MTPSELELAKYAISNLSQKVFESNVKAGWYRDPRTGRKIERNVPEMLMLTVSELSEAMEGYRKDLMDDKLSHRKMFEVELADVLIRLFDLAGYQQLDLGSAFVEKYLFNQTRADHTLAVRAAEGGKKF